MLPYLNMWIFNLSVEGISLLHMEHVWGKMAWYDLMWRRILLYVGKTCVDKLWLLRWLTLRTKYHISKWECHCNINPFIAKTFFNNIQNLKRKSTFFFSFSEYPSNHITNRPQNQGLKACRRLYWCTVGINKDAGQR